MLVRIGSRGSRLALTQAELAAARRCARAGHEIALVPITTAGDRDRKSPFGQIGERGVFVKEIEEALLARPDRRRRALGQGHDLDRHRRARRRRLSRARRSTRRARSAPSALEPGMRIGTASVRRRAQLLALRSVDLGRAAARKRRDAPAQGARARARRARCSPPAGSTGSGSRDEIGLRIPVETMLPEAAQGALALQVRAGEEELVAAGDSRETRRRVEAERACVAAIGAGCLAPVAAHHDGER